jgi:hypothetical protein
MYYVHQKFDKKKYFSTPIYGIPIHEIEIELMHFFDIIINK